MVEGPLRGCAITKTIQVSSFRDNLPHSCKLTLCVRNHTLTSVENQKRKKKIIGKFSIKVFKFYFILFYFCFYLKGNLLLVFGNVNRFSSSL